MGHFPAMVSSVLCAAFVLAVAAAIPTAPVEYTSQYSTIIKLSNGQSKSDAGTQYISAVQNATRFDSTSTGQTIVTLYGTMNKLMLVQNGACKAYCPANGEFFNPLQPGDGKKGKSMAKDAGTATVDGVSCELWTWQDLLIIVPMDTQSLYLNKASAFDPVLLSEDITPFGKTSVGTANQTFKAFNASKLDPSLFAVSGIANCPMSSGCQQQSTGNFGGEFLRLM